MKPVIDIKAVSRKELDDAVSAAQIAAAEVKGAQARVAEAKLNLDYTRVEAPISGVYEPRAALRGHARLGPGRAAHDGDADRSDLRHLRHPGERAAARSAATSRRSGCSCPPTAGSTSRWRSPTAASTASAGKVDFTDVRVNTHTGTVEARAELPNPGGGLKPGQFVRALLDGAVRPAAITVPQRAVLEGPKGKFVYVVNAESKAEPRPVRGRRVGGRGVGDRFGRRTGRQGDRRRRDEDRARRAGAHRRAGR